MKEDLSLDLEHPHKKASYGTSHLFCETKAGGRQGLAHQSIR